MTDPKTFRVTCDPHDLGAWRELSTTLDYLSRNWAGISFEEMTPVARDGLFGPATGEEWAAAFRPAPRRPIGSLAVVTGDTVDPIDGEPWYHGFAADSVVRIIASEADEDGTYLVESDDRPEARWVHERDLEDYEPQPKFDRLFSRPSPFAERERVFVRTGDYVNRKAGIPLLPLVGGSVGGDEFDEDAYIEVDLDPADFHPAPAPAFAVGDRVRTVRETKGVYGPLIPAGTEGEVEAPVLGGEEHGRTHVRFDAPGPGARFIPTSDLEPAPAPSVVVREPVLPSQETRDRYFSELRRLEGRNAFVIGDRVRKWSSSQVYFDGEAHVPTGRPAPKGATGEVLATYDDGDVSVQWDGLAGATYSTLIAGYQLRKVNR